MVFLLNPNFLKNKSKQIIISNKTKRITNYEKRRVEETELATHSNSKLCSQGFQDLLSYDKSKTISSLEVHNM